MKIIATEGLKRELRNNLIEFLKHTYDTFVIQGVWEEEGLVYYGYTKEIPGFEIFTLPLQEHELFLKDKEFKREFINLIKSLFEDIIFICRKHNYKVTYHTIDYWIFDKVYKQTESSYIS